MMNITDEINVLKARIAELNELASTTLTNPATWQPMGGTWWIDSEGIIHEVPSTPETKNFGMERPTKVLAEQALIELRRFHRLLALRDELCGDEVVDWESTLHDKWTVRFDNDFKIWKTSNNQFMQYITSYFTTQEHAKRACEMLNSGEVEL